MCFSNLLIGFVSQSQCIVSSSTWTLMLYKNPWCLKLPLVCFQSGWISVPKARSGWFCRADPIRRQWSRSWRMQTEPIPMIQCSLFYTNLLKVGNRTDENIEHSSFKHSWVLVNVSYSNTAKVSEQEVSFQTLHIKNKHISHRKCRWTTDIRPVS